VTSSPGFDSDAKLSAIAAVRQSMNMLFFAQEVSATRTRARRL